MTELEFKMSSVCRLCIKSFGDYTMVNIFHEDSEGGTPLTEKIKSCTSIEVCELDGLPSAICTKCQIMLDQSYGFKLQCVQADFVLKNFVETGYTAPLEIFLKTENVSNDSVEPTDSLVSTCSRHQSVTEAIPPSTSMEMNENSETYCKTRRKPNTIHGKENSSTVLSSPQKSSTKNDTSKKPRKVKRKVELTRRVEALLKKYKSKTTKRTQTLKTVVSLDSEKSVDNVLSNIPANNSVGAGETNSINSASVIDSKTKEIGEECLKRAKSENVEMVSVEPDVFDINHKDKQPELDEIKKDEDDEADTEFGEEFWAKRISVKSKRRGRKSLKYMSKEKPSYFTCEHCQKVYPSEGGWRYHIHTVHNVNYQPFICDLCGKSFKVKKNLEGHKNSIHFHLKQHLCDLCGRGFASKYALKVHKIWHSDEKNFECDVCGAKFRTRGKMNTHRTIHGGPKKFMCEICSRNFRWKKDFEIHMRTHTGEKPFNCSYCAKAFSSLTNMKKHEKNHMSDNRTYVREIGLREDREFKTGMITMDGLREEREFKSDMISIEFQSSDKLMCKTEFSFDGFTIEDRVNRQIQ